MKKCVLFDLDGTVVNTVRDIQEAINYTLSLVYTPLIDEEECKSVVGNGLKNALKNALILKRRSFEPDEMEILNHELLAYYKKNPCVYSLPYPGIVDFLLQLKKDGFSLGLISNKAENLVMEIVDKLFPTNLFDYVGGEKTGVKLKPDVEAFLICREALGSEDDTEFLYVGDSEVDYTFSGNCKIKSAIVSWGFRSKDYLVNKGVKPLFDDIDQLKEYIYESFRKTEE